MPLFHPEESGLGNPAGLGALSNCRHSKKSLLALLAVGKPDHHGDHSNARQLAADVLNAMNDSDVRVASGMPFSDYVAQTCSARWAVVVSGTFTPTFCISEAIQAGALPIFVVGEGTMGGEGLPRLSTSLFTSLGSEMDRALLDRALMEAETKRLETKMPFYYEGVRFSSFGVIISAANVSLIKAALALPPERIEAMQAALDYVRERFTPQGTFDYMQRRVSTGSPRPSATAPAAAWELAPTAQAQWRCGVGQRNADESECLAAVVAASGGKANGHIKLVDTPLVPAGCSYSHVSGAALFNSGAGQVGSKEEDYQLVCATDESFGAALDEVLPDGGARRIMALYSCMVPSLETTCPAAKSYSAHRFSFDLPPDAHWLFFGPSYLREISNSIIAATADEIIGTADPLSRPQDSDDVYQCGTRSENTRCEPSTADPDRFTLTFANGAKLTSVTNDAQSQDEDDPEAMARLERMLLDGKFTHAFYMPPHEPDYFAEHAAAEADDRSVNSSLLGHTSCCVKSGAGLDIFHQCVESRLTWQAVKSHVNRTTLVTPFNLGQASSSASSTTDVFYTDYIDRVYPCGVLNGIVEDNPTYGVGYQLDSKEWLELGGGGCHRCTVVCEAADGSVDAPPHRCAGGPVLVLAEELLRSIAGSLRTTRTREASAAAATAASLHRAGVP